MKRRSVWYQASPHAEEMARTTSMYELDDTVYGPDQGVHRYTMRNPMLSEEHIRHLFPSMRDESDIYNLLRHPNFPSDLLHKLAVEDNDLETLELVIQSKNILPETKVVVALKKESPIRQL